MSINSLTNFRSLNNNNNKTIIINNFKANLTRTNKIKWHKINSNNKTKTTTFRKLNKILITILTMLTTIKIKTKP